MKTSQNETIKKGINDGLLSDNEKLIRSKNNGQIVAIIKNDNTAIDQPIKSLYIKIINNKFIFDGSDIIEQVINIKNQQTVNKLELDYDQCINKFHLYISNGDDRTAFNLMEKCLDLITAHNKHICYLLGKDFSNKNMPIDELDIIVDSFITIIYLFKYLNIICYKSFHTAHDVIDVFLKNNYNLIREKFENLLIPQNNYNRNELYFYEYLFAHDKIDMLKQYSSVDSRFDGKNIIEELINSLLKESKKNNNHEHNNFHLDYEDSYTHGDFHLCIDLYINAFSKSTINNIDKLYCMLVKLKNARDVNDNFSKNGFLDKNYQLNFNEGGCSEALRTGV